jgi:long-chain acyl-CoA synthetase
MSVHRLGGTTVVMERFDPTEFLALVERYRVTRTQLVPTMFVRLLRLPVEVRTRFDLSSLVNVVHAAAPCPVGIKHEMIRWWGPIIDEYYAGTSDIGSTWIPCAEWLGHPGSVGRPTGEAHIVGPEGEEVGPGEEGLIYFVGGTPFEYHNDPEKTAGVSNGRGWRTLGDIGYFDDEGYLYLTDRQSNMIVSGGVNIYPQESENVLLTHPSVADAAVIGVPNQEMGEEVKAVVVTVDPTQATEATADVRSWRASSVRGPCRSPTPFRATPTGSSTSACCATSTGPGTTPGSSEPPRLDRVRNAPRWWPAQGSGVCRLRNA